MTPEQQQAFEKAWNDWRESLTREDLEGDPRDLVSSAFRQAFSAALEAATAEAATYRGALAWIRDGLDQMYSVTNEHGLRRLPPELENHAGIIGGLHRTAIIALGENPDGGPR